MTNIGSKRDLDQLSQLAHKLKSALLKGHEDSADSFAMQIEQQIKDGRYLEIYDEAILADAAHALERYYFEDPNSFSDELRLINQHLVLVHDVHANLQAVLDPTLSIETLLYERLNQWLQLENGLDYVFERATESDLQQIRARGPKTQTLTQFFEVYFEQLAAAGYVEEIASLQYGIQNCIDAFERLCKSTVRGLFLVDGIGEVAEISIKCSSKPIGQPSVVDFNHKHDENMHNAAKRALDCAIEVNNAADSYNYKIEMSRPYLDYGGSSIGLALGVGYIAEIDNLPVSPYIAFTGHLEFKTGKVTSVLGIEEKLQAAIRSGIHEVFIPAADETAVSEATAQQIVIHPVAELKDVVSNLKNRTYETAEPSLEARIRKAQLRLKKVGFELIERDEKQDHIQLRFWNGETIPIAVYHTHKFVVGGSDKKLRHKSLVNEIFMDVFGFATTDLQTEKTFSHENKTRTIDIPLLEMRERVKAFLSAQDGCSFGTGQYCDYTANIIDGKYKVNINQYTKGKLVFQGKDDPLFLKIETGIEGVLGIVNLDKNEEEKKTPQTKLEMQQAAVTAVDVGEAWIGTDESGKGDYFGPLVSAAVFVTHNVAEQLEALGVADSKKLTDKRVHNLAPQIERICGSHCAKVIVNPEKYNELYEQFQAEGKNLNSLLAWTHVRALENILPNLQLVSPLTVIIDKFADENYIQSRLKPEKYIKGNQKTELRLVQLPKAEANIAVAAASIIARYYFLQQLSRLSQAFGVELPKGASDPRIINLGRTIVEQHGESGLSRVAKLHFRTTQRILSG
jgi:ribonuclease HIII